MGQLWGSLEAVGQWPLRNIGPGGALLETRFPLALESVHDGRLTLDGQMTDVEVRIRHVTDLTSPTGAPRYLVGIEFVGLPPAAQEQIERLVSAGGAGMGRQGGGLT